MCQEVVAVALQIVTDEVGIVAVGAEANPFREEWIGNPNLLQTERSLFAGDLGNLVDQFTGLVRGIVKANFAPSGNPWKIDASGKRIRVAAKEAPKITMNARKSRNNRRSPPIMISATSTTAPAIRPRPVAISMEHSEPAYAKWRRPPSDAIWTLG